MSLSQPNQENVLIAGIFDRSEFSWGGIIFPFTIQKIRKDFGYNNLEYVITDSNCDETTAVRAYWELRTMNDDRPMHGIVGARCSGASVSIARIAGLEGVNQVSPASTSSRLSDKEEFPFFTRMVAPDDARGEVGALVATLRWFGWERVTILSTDTLYAKDYVNQFRKLWEGTISYSNVMTLDVDGSLDTDSVIQALKEAPTDDPANNARVVLLVAQSQHAYPILEIASTTNLLQPDTIWVGTSAWVGRPPSSGVDLSTLIDGHPGYLGLGPPRSSGAASFLQELNAYMTSSGLEPYKELPPFAAEMADGITALAQAIYSVPENQRRDAYQIRRNLWNSDFFGAGGSVQFTSLGDRQNPQYSVLHLKRSANDDLEWIQVGDTGTVIGNATVVLNRICFATLGCNLDEPPSDSYPVPRVNLAGWAIAFIVILVIMFILVAVKYWRSRKSKQQIRNELETFRDSVVGMRTAETTYIPSVDSGKTPNASLLTQKQWCWQETSHLMKKHDAESIAGDPADCWIKYDSDVNSKLETSFQEQGKKGTFSPIPGYIVDFEAMTQTKQATGFVRSVQRLVESSSLQGNAKPGDATDSAQVTIGETLPEDLKKEPQIVLVPGDVIQISKQRSDGKWAFGTKLYHADELVTRDIVASLSQQGAAGGNDDVNVLVDTGWFMLDVTRMPSAEDLAILKQKVGDTDSLKAPSNWNDVADPTVVKVHKLKAGDPEYDAVSKAFMSSIGNRKGSIASIKRVENLAMWQSYVVKRQTICYRETGQTANTPNADTIQRRALQRFERYWLWHGTNAEVMDKILQQGFNRSFCGKNATVYGKGVYFARDSSYSSNKTYAVPDSRGFQYIMACRVVVGEYCPGITNALTPDIRDPKTHTLYDSTVGILSGDSLANPSIYVTYHDAQAYPEVSEKRGFVRKLSFVPPFFFFSISSRSLANTSKLQLTLFFVQYLIQYHQKDHVS